MSEEDDAEYRRIISDLLTKHGFAWVVEQASTQIAEGKPTSKQVSEREYVSAKQDPMFRIAAPRRRSASLITSEPYSESEQLEILLQAFEAAIVQRASLEEALFSFEKLGSVETISFQSERPIDERDTDKSFLLPRTRLESAREIKRQAENVLSKMRKRSHDDT